MIRQIILKIVLSLLILTLMACSTFFETTTSAPTIAPVEATDQQTETLAETPTVVTEATPVMTPTASLTETAAAMPEDDMAASSAIEVVEAPVELVTVEVVSASQVNVTVQGSFANGCYEMADITQSQETSDQGLTFVITLTANHNLEAMCIQQIISFEEVITLDTQGVPPGTYQVVVNGVSQSFDLPAPANDNEAQPEATFPMTDSMSMTGPVIEGMYPVTDWRRVAVDAANVSVAVPTTWNDLGMEWSPSPTGTPRIGLTSMTTEADWQPTAILPVDGHITGRLAVDVEWAEGLLYQVEQTNTIEVHIVAPLDGPTAYDFYVIASRPEELAQIQTVHDYFAKSAEFPQPMTDTMTDSRPPTGQLFTSLRKGYSFYYPDEFVINQPSPRMTQVLGPAGPMRASLEISSRPAMITLDEAVQETLRGLPATFAVTQSTTTLGGEPAVFIEGLPGRLASRRAFVIHQGELYTLDFSPVDNAPSEVQAQVENLWQLVITSFSFDPAANEPAMQATPSLTASDASSGLTPVSPAECQEFQQAMEQTLGVSVNLREAPINDFITGESGLSCLLAVETTGAELSAYADHLALADALIALFTGQGWQENIDYAAAGPTGTGTALENGDSLAILGVQWEPTADADCPTDQPIAECQLTPAQQLYTIQVRLAER